MLDLYAQNETEPCVPRVELQWQVPAGCFIRRTRTQVIAGTFTVHQGGNPAYNMNTASANTGKVSNDRTFNLERLTHLYSVMWKKIYTKKLLEKCSKTVILILQFRNSHKNNYRKFGLPGCDIMYMCGYEASE